MAQTVEEIINSATLAGNEVHVQKLGDGFVLQVVDKKAGVVTEYPYVEPVVETVVAPETPEAPEETPVVEPKPSPESPA